MPPTLTLALTLTSTLTLTLALTLLQMDALLIRERATAETFRLLYEASHPVEKALGVGVGVGVGVRVRVRLLYEASHPTYNPTYLQP